MCDKNACGFCWGFFPPGFAYHGRFLEINHITHTKKKAPRSLCYMLFDEQLTYFINVAYLGYNGIIQLEIQFQFFYLCAAPLKWKNSEIQR